MVTGDVRRVFWWVEIYCTLKTNWKNNLIADDSDMQGDGSPGTPQRRRRAQLMPFTSERRHKRLPLWLLLVAFYFFISVLENLAACPPVCLSSRSRSLFPQDADACIAPLRRHRGDHLPRVDNWVITFNTAEERVPIISRERCETNRVYSFILTRVWRKRWQKHSSDEEHQRIF